MTEAAERAGPTWPTDASRRLARLIADSFVEKIDDDEADSASHGGAEQRRRRLEQARFARFVERVNVADRQHRAAERSADRRLPRVFPVYWPLGRPNLALAQILAYCQAFDGGHLRELYDLEPYWLVRRQGLRKLLQRHGPSVFLFSNYVWSHEENLAVSAVVKQLSPESITIHGGADTPQDDRASRSHFARHPHMDICVRGEGEVATAEILESLGGRLAGRGGDLSELAGITGISFRSGDDVVRTPDRDRITDLRILPSPMSAGVIDAFGGGIASSLTIETNRGCPYGCTFCDWGSATLSRIRKFDLDRVVSDLEWAAENRVAEVFVADANFGIFARDVEIAEKVAELHQRTGFPRSFRTSFAKNTVKHIEAIVEVLVRNGILTEGILSLQTNDTATLDAVHRSNIAVSKYDDLAATFRDRKLPLFTDLMFGLPGSTLAAFGTDLQVCIDREINARIHPTQMLVNSPMNEPSYRALHGIEVEKVREPFTDTALEVVVATATFDRHDHETMIRWRSLFYIAENFGVFRHVARWVRQETGVPEMALYEHLDLVVSEQPERHPLLTWAVRHLISFGIPPLSWTALYDDLRRFLVDDVGVGAGADLDTVLEVQRAVLPERGADYPREIVLQHDYVRWFAELLAAKQRGEDRCAVVPRLASFPPGRLVVDDPAGLARLAGGSVLDLDLANNWELDSAVSRFLPSRHTRE